jgi:predicted phage terminase large subunit-like protein
MDASLMDAVAAEMALSERYLKHFIKFAWETLEPHTPFKPGWHIDAICDHLQAVTDGEITRLIINIPPRHMKSLSVGVLWPAWEWGPKNMPYTRWLCSSYAETLATRDSLKTRRLIQSPWYKLRWGDKFSITSDQNKKTRFENDRQGYRVATTVRGVGTGEGGDRICTDDPHNVIKGESELDRLMTLRWWDESMSTRVNNPETAAKVIVMQRVHDKDLCGHVLSKDLGYVHLCLPARYEKRHITPVSTPHLKEDPRTEEGEPLWDAMYHHVALSILEKEMTEYARAGQLQQRPAPRGGGLFKVDRFKLVNSMPTRPQVVRAVRYWDKAGTEGGGKRTAGTLMVVLKGGGYRICDCEKGQWSTGKRERIIKQTAQIDDARWKGINVHQVIEQEPGSGGKDSALGTLRNLAGHVAKKDVASNNKVTRSEPYQAAIENGQVELVIDKWTQEFIDEHETAPNGQFADQWDSAAGAFNYVHGTKTAGTW